MKNIILLIFFASIFQSNAQVDLRWDVLFTGNDSNLFSDVAHSTDGGCYIIGSSSSTDGVFADNHGARDGYIAKYDSDGNILWDYVFGGSQVENINDIISLADGSVIIAGSTNSSDGDLEGAGSSSGLRELLAKFDSDGNILWINTYSNGNTISAKMDSDGKLYIITPNGSLNNGNVRVSKIDANGERLWSNNIEGSAISQRVDITIDEERNVYQLTDFSSDNNGTDIRIIKYDADGNELWRNTYGGNGNDGASNIEVWKDALVVTGITNSTTGEIVAEYGSSDGFIASIDYDGALLNSYAIGGSEFDEINDIKVVNEQLYICGTTSSMDNGFDIPSGVGGEIFVSEIDENGIPKWITLNGNAGIEFNSHLDIVNDSMIVLGYALSSLPNGGNEDTTSLYIAYYDYDYISVATNDIQPVNILLYPNPTQDFINIRGDVSHDHVMILSTSNGTVLTAQCMDSGNSIDLRQYPTGFYTISIMEAGKLLLAQSISKL